MSAPFGIGVTWWPAETGPYLWHEPVPAAYVAELHAVSAAGIREVRVPLAWDAFMPSWRTPSSARLRDFEQLLQAAGAVGVRVVPVLFAQSWGDCVFLPAYAVDRRAPRRGVRVVCDGGVLPGGPRDMYTDPLMLEMQLAWLDGMLEGFGNHPAIAAWDLGHDPATAVRPRRIAHLTAWVALLADRIHERGDRVHLTLGADDVLSARGVRLSPLVPLVDRLGLLLTPRREGGDVSPGAASDAFAVALARRLAGEESVAPALDVHLMPAVSAGAGDDEPDAGEDGLDTDDAAGAPRWERPLLDGAAAHRATEYLGGRLPEIGASAGWWHWSDTATRTLAAPPFDRVPSLARCGLRTAQGRGKPHLDVVASEARRERAVWSGDPPISAVDVASYYDNLPGSVRDLRAAWPGEGDDGPAILS